MVSRFVSWQPVPHVSGMWTDHVACKAEAARFRLHCKLGFRVLNLKAQASNKF